MISDKVEYDRIKTLIQEKILTEEMTMGGLGEKILRLLNVEPTQDNKDILFAFGLLSYAQGRED